MQNYEWYQLLIKPSFAPPAWVFGPVWTILYILIAISFGYVFYLWFRRRISFAIALPFLLNLVFNFAFTPVLFGLQNLTLASIDILLVLGTLIWGVVVIYRTARWVTWINIPYVVWVGFATVLQLTIFFLN
ncbi:MAG: tryptophan-rich sensory protein [Candidatus Nomurabacteria bacterium]|nr:tryptophan-rich sensory protein [Candidatus Nomurabacteria bacterium]